LLPKISIITPSFNQGQYIEQTILSVLDQNYPNLEYILIDGGSTDNTLEVIKKYEDKITYWVSEPDRGQAHAINKGLEKASGEIFNWINSDDYLEHGALFEIGEYFKNNPDKNVLCGYTRCFFDSDNSTSHEYMMGIKDTVADSLINVEMNQPASFYKTALVKELGGVNESLRYVFDDELWFKYICKFGLHNIGATNKRLAEFRLHGSSKSVGEGYEGFQKEIQSIYLDLATQCKGPEWLLEQMKQKAYSSSYISTGNWDMGKLETERFLAAFASRFVNNLYCSGRKKWAAIAMKMAICNGYFKWNRMMTSLRLKLLFA